MSYLKNYTDEIEKAEKLENDLFLYGIYFIIGVNLLSYILVEVLL